MKQQRVYIAGPITGLERQAVIDRLALAERHLTLLGFREERDRDVAASRYLPAVAASDCERCYGSGVEVVEGRGARTCTNCRRA